MKKVAFLILLFISCLSVTFAETTNIKTKVSLNGKDLEEGEFSFYLEDNKGNVIKEVKNDKDGVVDFGEIELPEAPEQYQTETNTFYYIVQKNEGIEGYTYDDKKILVRLRKDFNSNIVSLYTFELGSVEKEYKDKIPKYEYKEPYHATEEELEGEAYGVFDLETKTLSFIRIKDLDTSSFSTPFGSNVTPDRAVDLENKKVYYRGGEDSAERLEEIITTSYFLNNVEIKPTKIEFKEAFKPKFTNLNFVRYSSKRGIFAYGNLDNKEVDFSHFDTSNITDMASAFESTRSKKLDLSSFDTSKVTTMSSMFMNSHDIEELDLRSFTFESLESAQYMFHAADHLRTLKISSHSQTNKLKDANYMFGETKNIESMDMTWLMLGPESYATGIFHTCGFEYLDLSHWDFENPEQSIFSTSFSLPRLKYIDISNLRTPLCGAYSSGDFRFYESSIEVIKLGDQFNGIYGMLDNNFAKLFNVTTGEYTRVLNGAGRSACEYYPGGDYLNVKNSSVLGETIGFFENNYEEPKIETVIVENPNTKDVFVILFSVLVISFSILIIIKEAKVRA